MEILCLDLEHLVKKVRMELNMVGCGRKQVLTFKNRASYI